MISAKNFQQSLKTTMFVIPIIWMVLILNAVSPSEEAFPMTPGRNGGGGTVAKLPHELPEQHRPENTENNSNLTALVHCGSEIDASEAASDFMGGGGSLVFRLVANTKIAGENVDDDGENDEEKKKTVVAQSSICAVKIPAYTRLQFKRLHLKRHAKSNVRMISGCSPTLLPLATPPLFQMSPSGDYGPFYAPCSHNFVMLKTAPFHGGPPTVEWVEFSLESGTAEDAEADNMSDCGSPDGHNFAGDLRRGVGGRRAKNQQ